MKKIVLNNGREINVLNVNASSFTAKITASEMLDVFNDLTEENLETITVKDNDIVSEIFTNKCRSSVNYDGTTAIFYIDDVDITSKKIKELEDTIDALILSDMGIGESEEWLCIAL